MKKQDNKRLTLTIPEAAERLGISRNLGYEAAKDGSLPVVRIGRRLLVPRAALDSLLAQAGTGQPKAA